MAIDLVSDETVRVYVWVVYTGLSMMIAVFGIVTNIINIICFVKQGLRDSVNVSLLGLAISDLGSLVTTAAACILYTPAIADLDLPYDLSALSYLLCVWPHIIFVRVTGWITALITVERCLCVAMPLKVKGIITPNRVTIIIVIISIVVVGSNAPVYYSNRLAKVYFPEKNRTILTLVYTEDRVIIDQVAYAISNVVIPLSAFLTVIVSTLILVVKLQSKSRWRQKNTVSENVNMLSDRDQKVAKMVVMISTLFIACFIPLSLTFIGMIVEPELAVGGQYKNTIMIVGGGAFILESINSASNIFIYYRLSSRYKTVFRQTFLCKE